MARHKCGQCKHEHDRHIEIVGDDAEVRSCQADGCECPACTCPGCEGIEGMEEEKKKPTIEELERMIAQGPVEILPDGAVKPVDPLAERLAQAEKERDEIKETAEWFAQQFKTADLERIRKIKLLTEAEKQEMQMRETLKQAIRLIELMKPRDPVWNQGDEGDLIRFRAAVKA